MPTNTFVAYFLSLQLTLRIFPSNVWWAVARRVIARSVGSHLMSEETYQSFQKEIKTIPKSFLNIRLVGVELLPLQKKGLDRCFIHSGRTFHIPTYLHVLPPISSINFTKGSSKTILSTGVFKSQERKK